MPSDVQAAKPTILPLKVSGHLMAMEPGLFCVFNSPGPQPSDRSGLPGIRLSLAPDADPAAAPLEFASFRGDGWVGEFNDAALVRVLRPCQMLVTIYQQASVNARSPNLQVVRIAEPVPDAGAPAMAAAEPAPPAAATAEILAHIQSRGDVAGALGGWIGEPGSGRWIEGFQMAPAGLAAAEDIEYQAVLGRGWLSPWMQGGEFCGSRGMALPVLGLRARLRDDAQDKVVLTLEASFTDGTRIGPVGPGEACEAPNLAPLEAFRVILAPRVVIGEAAEATAPAPAAPASVAPVAVASPKAKPASKTKSNAKSGAKSGAKPAAKPMIKAGAKADAKLGAKPGAKPAVKKPAAAPKPDRRRPAGKPAGRPQPRPKGRRS